MTFSESAMSVLMARKGISTPLCSTHAVNREIPCAAEFAWTVEIVPLWPVFRSWSKSKASPPRISPNYDWDRPKVAAFESPLVYQYHQ